MTADKILYTYVNTTLSITGSFVYGSAEGESAPYIVMFKIDDPERPETLCDNQGEAGVMRLQFNGYTGGNSGATLEYLQAFKEQFKDIKGTIGTAPNQILIWDNVTEGARVLGDAVNQEGIWGVLFEATLRWRYV